MRLKVLGCSGGIGGKNLTTAFLLGDHVLIDVVLRVAEHVDHRLRSGVDETLVAGPFGAGVLMLSHQ